jgi:transposase
MKRFVEGEDRLQVALLPHCLDDYVTENNPVRVIEAFIDELDLATLGFEGVVLETTGRPAYHPAYATEDLSLRLSQPHPVEPAPGAGDPA